MHFIERQQILTNLSKDCLAFGNYCDAIHQQMKSTFNYRYSIIQNFTNNIETTIVQIRKSKQQQQHKINAQQQQIQQTQIWIETKKISIQLKTQQIKHCEQINRTLQERVARFKKQEERLYQIINKHKGSFQNQNIVKNTNNNNGRKSILMKKNVLKNSKKQQGIYKHVEFDMQNNKMMLKFKNQNGEQHFIDLFYSQKDDKFLVSNSKQGINYKEKLHGLVQQFNTHLNLKQLYLQFIQLAKGN